MIINIAVVCFFFNFVYYKHIAITMDHSKQFKKLSVIIPAYNEARTLREIIRRVQAVQLTGLEKEIIIVDNGSIDDTPLILKLLSGIRVLTLNPNRGKGGAVKAGFTAATGDILIIQDADLEYEPNDYPAVIRPILEGKTEVTVGIRINPSMESRSNKSLYWLSWLGNKMITWTTNLLYGNKAGEYEGCYKAFTKELISQITVRTDDFDFDNELICKILKKGYKTVDVPIHYYPRSYQEGKKINWKHGFKILWTIIKYRFIN